MINPAYEIEKLLIFGQANNMPGKWDLVPVRNSLLELFQIYEPFYGDIDYQPENSPVETAWKWHKNHPDGYLE